MTSCYMKTEASMKICKFSTETKDYLSCFYSILDSMVQNMESIELCDSISHNFIAQMIPHHQAAIEMANNLLNHSCWLPLRRIATNIISSQTKSIDSMCDSLDCCDEPINSQCDQDLYNRHFHNIMHKQYQRQFYTADDSSSPWRHSYVRKCAALWYLPGTCSNPARHYCLPASGHSGNAASTAVHIPLKQNCKTSSA